MNEQIGNKINDKTYIKLTPFKGWVLENFPFIEDDFDCITNYQLICKIVEYLNNVISNQNQVQELGTELVNAYNTLVDAVNLAINEFETDITGDFNDLKDYVDNYFDNNFPELVSDKLDEMAEDGTLSNLLNNYANIIKVYNTYTDLIADSSTFINGLRLKTLGYYSVNDGGAAEYIVTNTANNTKYQVALSNNLYLELIFNDSINVKQFGAYGDDTHDDTIALQKAIDFGYINKINVFIPDGIYLITETIKIYGGNDSSDNSIIIYGTSRGSTTIKTNEEIDIIQVSLYGTNTASANVYLKDLRLDGNNVALNGLHIICQTTNSKFENLNIRNCIECGVTNKINTTTGNSTYSTKFINIRCDYCSYGFLLLPGVNTSIRIADSYVQNADYAYNISSIYSLLENCCADHITNTVFKFNYFTGAIINPGSESPHASYVFHFTQSKADVIGANTYGNMDSADAVHIFAGTNSQVNFNGGTVLAKLPASVNDTALGKLFQTGALSKITFNNVNIASNYALNDSYADIQCGYTDNNGYGIISRRYTSRLSYIGRDTSLTDGKCTDKCENDTVYTNAIYFGLGNSYQYGNDGADYHFNRRSQQGDILLSRKPKEIGGIGWVQSQDLTGVNDTNWLSGEYLKIPVILSGESSSRPTKLVVGQMYFDTTLGKPIWYNGTKWVDATGTQV